MTQAALKDDLLDGAEAAAKFIGISRKQVYRLTESGDLPVVRMGKRLYYRKSELERVFEAEPLPAEAQERSAKLPRAPAKPAPCPDDVCTWAEMLPLFVELYEPNAGRWAALGARLKNLQRIGLLDRPSPGKGRSAYYTMDDLRRLLTAMELCSLGISPAAAVDLCHRYGDLLLMGEQVAPGPRASTICLDYSVLRDAARKHLPKFFYPMPGPLPSKRSSKLRGATAVAAQGTSAFGQDAQRLEAKPAGPVAEGHAPNHDITRKETGSGQ